SREDDDDAQPAGPAPADDALHPQPADRRGEAALSFHGLAEPLPVLADRSHADVLLPRGSLVAGGPGLALPGGRQVPADAGAPAHHADGNRQPRGLERGRPVAVLRL